MSAAVQARERYARLRARLGEEHGFTLIEMLVALVAGIIVSAAMGAIVITSVHLGSSTADRVDANQQGRVAMEKITQQLDSACVANTAPPVVSNGATGPVGNPAVSDGTHMWFYTAVAPGQAVTDSANINPSLVEIYLSNGALVETAYPWLGGTAPAPANTTPWYFDWTNPTTFTLLPHVAEMVASNGTTLPIFQYYGYTSAAVGTLSTTAYTTSPSLGATDAATTAEVTVSFMALPTDNWNTPNRGTDLTDSVVLRLTPASSQANAANAPCS